MLNLEVPEVPGNRCDLHPDLPGVNLVPDGWTWQGFLFGAVVTLNYPQDLVVCNPPSVGHSVKHIALAPRGMIDFVLPVG